MQTAGVVLCFLCVSVNAAGNVRNLRGFADPVLWPSSSQLAQETGWAASPGHGDKTWPMDEAKTFHDDYVRPLTSLKEFALVNGPELVISAVLWIAFVLVVAFFYNRSSRYIPETAPKPLDSIDAASLNNELTSWQAEWYQCYRYPEIFFWSCCCPCIRWAHTMDLMQFVDYWPAFFIFLLLSVLNQLTAFVFFGLMLTILLTWYRQKTRKLFGMEHYATCPGFTMDCLGLCFCWPCFIAQEANHVTQAMKLGWKTDSAVKTGSFSAKHEPSVSQEG